MFALFGEPNHHPAAGARGFQLLLDQTLFQQPGLEFLSLSGRQSEALVPGRYAAVAILYNIPQEGDFYVARRTVTILLMGALFFSCRVFQNLILRVQLGYSVLHLLADLGISHTTLLDIELGD